MPKDNRLLVSGSMDLVGNYERASKEVFGWMKEAGFLQMKLYKEHGTSF